MKELNNKLNYCLFFFIFLTSVLFTCRKLMPAFSLLVIAAVIIMSILALVKSFLSLKLVESELQRKYYFFFFVMVFYLALMGLYNNIMYERVDSRYYLLDASTLFIIMGSINFCVRGFDSKKLAKWALNFLGIFGVICGIVSILTANWNLAASRNENVFSIQYVMWGMLFVWPYLIFKLFLDNEKKSKFEVAITVLCAAEYVVLALLFQKRVVFFELVGVIAVIAVCYRKKIAGFAKTIITILIFVAVALFVVVNLFNLDITVMIDNVLGRYEGTDLDSYDRLNEFIDLFNQYNPVSIILGMGCGSVHSGRGGANMHIGWLNYIFKGGILLTALHVSLAVKSIRLMLASTKGYSLFISACCVYYYYSIATLSAWFPSGTLLMICLLQFIMLELYEKKFPASANKVLKSRRK